MNGTLTNVIWPLGMAQQVKVIATKFNNQSSFLGTPMVEGRNQFSDIYLPVYTDNK